MIKAEYVDHMGTDLTVVNSARVSFDKQSSFVDGVLSEKDTKLLNYLARENHFTPFTHCTITLRETVPIFVARQRFKHTVGFSYNETSRRYVDDTPEFYVPEDWRARPDGSVKQGSGVTHPKSSYWICQNKLLNVHSISLYQEMIEEGVAPEMARMVLPQSMLTSYYVTGSLMAFARVYNLRKDPHAQLEIQELADQIDSVISPLFPASWEALTSQNKNNH